MHELSMMRDLVHKAEAVVKESGGVGATEVIVRRGALTHMSTAHLKQHFEWVVHGTLLDGAELTIEDDPDVGAPAAQDLVLASVAVVGGDG